MSVSLIFKIGKAVRNLLGLLVVLISLPVFADDDITELLLGNWCLNTETYDGEITVDGSQWLFTKEGRYRYKQAYESVDNYRVEGNTIVLDNFGEMKVLSISAREMRTEMGSHYYFTKEICLPLVKDAEHLTRLNNAILKGDIDTVKALVAKGVDVSQADTRSSMRSTPAMVAIKSGQIEILQYILSFKPDLSIIDGSWKTALDHAKKTQNAEIINLVQAAQ